MARHGQSALLPPERAKRIREETDAAGAPERRGAGMLEKFLGKCGDLPSRRVDMPRTPEELAELDGYIADMERRARSLPPCPDAIR